MSLSAKVIKVGQGSKSRSFKLGHRYFTVPVLIDGFENGINDQVGLLLVFLLVL